jgi:hypothetical protein
MFRYPQLSSRFLSAADHTMHCLSETRIYLATGMIVGGAQGYFSLAHQYVTCDILPEIEEEHHAGFHYEARKCT